MHPVLILYVINQRIKKTKLGKAIPLGPWQGPVGSRRFRLPEFLDSRHMNVVKPVLLTGRLYPQEIPLVLTSVRS